MPDSIYAEMLAFLHLEQAVGGYEAAAQEHTRIERSYNAIASLLGAETDEIAIVENSTVAWQLAMQSLPLKEGDEVLTGEMEYASNYLALLHLSSRLGIKVKTIPSDSNGQVDLEVLPKIISSRTRAVCLTHVPSHRGDIQPVIAVGEICGEYELFYIVDACQSVGQLPIEVTQLQCDFLCGSGRKYLRGPRGTGFLYANQHSTRELQPAMIDLHSAKWINRQEYEIRHDARRFENWETFVAGKLALGMAAEYAMDVGITHITERIQQLATSLHGQLREGGMQMLERSDDYSGIVTFIKPNEDSEKVQRRLRQKSMNISIARPGNAVLEMAESNIGAACRASVHYFNTESEISSFVEALLAG